MLTLLAAALLWLNAAHSKEIRTIVLYCGSGQDLPRAIAFVAAKKEFFENEGMAIELRDGELDEHSDEILNSLTSHIGITSIFRLLRARSDGKSIVAFASAYARNPTVFYTRRSAEIKTISDLATKTVGYEKGSDSSILFDALLRRYNVSKSSIREVQSRQVLQSLTSGEVDVIPGSLGKESYSLSKAGFQFGQIDPNAFGLHLLGSVFVTNDKTLRSQPDLIQSFLRILLRALEIVLRNDPADRALVAESIGTSDLNQVGTLINSQRPLLRPTGRRFGELDTAEVRLAAIILLQQSLLKTSPGISDIINTELLADVYRAANSRAAQPN